MTKIKFIDTTIRDGHQSLWAMNMRTSHMLSTMPYLDSAGFEAIEFLAAGAAFKKLVRHLKENPWDWITGGSRSAKKTPLRWHGDVVGRTMSGYVPQQVGEMLVSKAVDLGIRYTRIGNKWNDFTTMSQHIARFERLGMTPIINIIYSVSPRHTDEYFIQKAREVSSLNPYRVCFKDVGGLLTPERIRALVPKMIEAAPGVTWEFHGHCNNSFGPVNALECAKLGIGIIHTSIPPLANANSQPSIYNVAANLRTLGFDPQIDEKILLPATEYLTSVAKKEGFQIGIPYEFDETLYRHQVPGGMISNLRYQLSLAGVGDRIEEVLEEVPRVRAELGYPIMVTPLSQIVGTQAAINVIVGERYKQVTDQTIEYTLGRHGNEAPEVMDPDVKDKILSRPRANELSELIPWEPTISELRTHYGRDISDEDLILMAIVGDDALDVVGSTSAGRPQLTKSRSLSELIKDLIAQEEHKFVRVDYDGLSFTMLKSAGSTQQRFDSV